MIHTIQLGKRLSFKSQSGVFSWNKVDKGSEQLINKAIIPSHPGSTVLDLGCGYGLIGIAIAKTFPEVKVIMTDINNLAIRLARENCKINSVQSNTEVRRGDLYQPIMDLQFDLIITNPPISAGKEILKKLVSEAPGHLKEDGSIQLVSPRKKGLRSTQRMLRETFGQFEVLGKGSGFWVLKAEKHFDKF